MPSTSHETIPLINLLRAVSMIPLLGEFIEIQNGQNSHKQLYEEDFLRSADGNHLDEILCYDVILLGYLRFR
jgi:hypothetical protein